MTKRILLASFLLLIFSRFTLSSEDKTHLNINISYGGSSFIILNVSKDKWSEDRLKLGLEGNLINRNIASVTQNVLDFKVYVGFKMVKEEDISIDLRIGYGINLGYYPSNNSTDFSYAPAIGASLKYGVLNCKIMSSFYQDGIAVPYLVGVNLKSLFIGLQGIYGINIGTQISTNLETGLCVGLSF